MRWLLAIALCFAGADGPSAQMLEDIVNAKTTVYSGYLGPGDIVTSADAWYGLRAYSSNQVSGTTKAVNLRRASDSTACDFDINTSGNLGGTDSGCSLGGGLSLATFATQDATATCTISTTTATCTGASSTPHAGSTITGSGLTQPCYASAVGTFTGGAGTVTVAGTGTSPCGTISVGETLTFRYGLYITEAYDQSGNGNNVTQATTTKQPQLLPSCLSSLPCMSFVAGQSQYLVAAGSISSNPLNTVSAISQRNGAFSSAGAIVGNVSGSNYAGYGSANLVASTPGPTATASDSVFHSLQFIGAAASASFISVDNVAGSASGVASVSWGTINLGIRTTSVSALQGYIAEAGVWDGNFNSTQLTNVCHNQYAYWGTSTSC